MQDRACKTGVTTRAELVRAGKMLEPRGKNWFHPDQGR